MAALDMAALLGIQEMQGLPWGAFLAGGVGGVDPSATQLSHLEGSEQAGSGEEEADGASDAAAKGQEWWRAHPVAGHSAAKAATAVRVYDNAVFTPERNPGKHKVTGTNRPLIMRTVLCHDSKLKCNCQTA